MLSLKTLCLHSKNLDLPLIHICTKIDWVVPWPMPSASWCQHHGWDTFVHGPHAIDPYELLTNMSCCVIFLRQFKYFGSKLTCRDKILHCSDSQSLCKRELMGRDWTLIGGIVRYIALGAESRLCKSTLVIICVIQPWTCDQISLSSEVSHGRMFFGPFSAIDVRAVYTWQAMWRMRLVNKRAWKKVLAPVIGINEVLVKWMGACSCNSAMKLRRK